MHVNLQLKQRTLTFLAQICPKFNLGLETEKSNVGISINIVRHSVCQFSAKLDKFEFFRPHCPKMELAFEIQKTNVGTRISNLGITCVPIFRQNEQL